MIKFSISEVHDMMKDSFNVAEKLDVTLAGSDANRAAARRKKVKTSFIDYMN